MTGTISGAGTAYTSGAPGFTPSFCGVRVARSLVFCVVFCRSLFVFFFLRAIVLSVFRRFTASLLITPLVALYFAYYESIVAVIIFINLE